MRIVSLVPSATETLLAWGVEPSAVTRFCEQGKRFRTVGGTKDPHVEAIVALQPDVVVMCDQENRIVDAHALETAGVSVHAISITSIGTVGPEMRRLALRIGVAPTLGDACGVGTSMRPERKRAYVPIWKRPWMTINHDTYGASVLASLGIVSVASGHADRYPAIDPVEARVLGADCVVAPSEPYAFSERHRAELEVAGPVVFVDGQDLFWWGVRTPAAQARLAMKLSSE